MGFFLSSIFFSISLLEFFSIFFRISISLLGFFFANDNESILFLFLCQLCFSHHQCYFSLKIFCYWPLRIYISFLGFLVPSFYFAVSNSISLLGFVLYIANLFFIIDSISLLGFFFKQQLISISLLGFFLQMTIYSCNEFPFYFPLRISFSLPTLFFSSSILISS